MTHRLVFAQPQRVARWLSLCEALTCRTTATYAQSDITTVGVIIENQRNTSSSHQRPKLF
jgi:hypothetical protein